MKLPIGIDDFKKLINEEYDFVDKSLFIKDIIEENAQISLITRPRRFGKTINLSMLETFLGIQKKYTNNLFHNLKISEHKDLCSEHQNKYPVIFITFKRVNSDNFNSALSIIKDLISQLYIVNKNLVYDTLGEHDKKLYNKIIDQDITEGQLQSSLYVLTRYYYEAFKIRPYLLIDEYDSSINAGYIHGYYNKITELMRGIFGNALKGNEFLEKGIVTGINKVAAESLFSELNNFRNYGVLDEKYCQYFGFTEQETLQLAEKAYLSKNKNQIKFWYNGYKFGNNTIYNPWSIINYLTSPHELKSYWINTSQNILVKKLLNESGTSLKDTFEKLMQNKPVYLPIEDNLIFPDLDSQEPAIWSLLLYSGYLTATDTELRRGFTYAKIYIPNMEVQLIYEKIFEAWFYGSKNLKLSHYESFINSLKNGDIKLFGEYLKNYISVSSSYFDFNTNTKENVFHSFLLGLIIGLKEDYIIKSNQEAGFGRFDVAFIPKNKNHDGIILEFKATNDINQINDCAKLALQQITDKKYTNIFNEHNIKKYNALGIAFCGKEVKIEFKCF